MPTSHPVIHEDKSPQTLQAQTSVFWAGNRRGYVGNERLCSEFSDFLFACCAESNLQTTDISSVCGAFFSLHTSVAHPHLRLNPERQMSPSPYGFPSPSVCELPTRCIYFSFLEKTQPPPPQTAKLAASSTINLMVSTEPLAGNERGEL